MPDNPLSYAEAIYQLINFHYQSAVEIGQRGKLKAQKLFNSDRYQADLFSIIEQVASGKNPKWDGRKLW
jgi:hypothetical protein